MTVLFAMIFFHILDDFTIQSIGFLSRGKQKSWWEINEPDPLYENDYVVALLMHSFSWAFIIMVPVWFALRGQLPGICLVMIVVNMIIHAIVDHLKANRHAINLITDQLIHLVQILVTFIVISYGVMR